MYVKVQALVEEVQNCKTSVEMGQQLRMDEY
jgi:hypothetical protein